MTGTSAYHEESEFKYDVTVFEIGTVKPGDVQIDFPAGTEVTDMVHNVAYEVLAAGKKKLLPMVITEKRMVRRPPTEDVTALPVEEAAKLYTTIPFDGAELEHQTGAKQESLAPAR